MLPLQDRTPNNWLLQRVESPGDFLGQILVLPAQLDGQWANTAATAEKGTAVRGTDLRDEGLVAPPGVSPIKQQR